MTAPLWKFFTRDGRSFSNLSMQMPKCHEKSICLGLLTDKFVGSYKNAVIFLSLMF